MEKAPTQVAAHNPQTKEFAGTAIDTLLVCHNFEHLRRRRAHFFGDLDDTFASIKEIDSNKYRCPEELDGAQVHCYSVAYSQSGPPY